MELVVFDSSMATAVKVALGAAVFFALGQRLIERRYAAPPALRRLEEIVRCEVPAVDTVIAVVVDRSRAVVLFAGGTAGEFGLAICREIGDAWDVLASSGGFEAECDLWVADPMAAGIDSGIGVYCRKSPERATATVVSEGRAVEARVVDGWVVAFDWDVPCERWPPVLVDAP